MFKAIRVLPILLFAAQFASADLIVRWDFGNATTAPSEGTGVASLVGTNQTFASDTVNGGSTDPVVPNHFGWNTALYPGRTVGNMTEGVQFTTSTVGFQDITLTFDVRPSSTASRYIGIQYTTDGSTWTDFGPLFELSGGETWFNQRQVDLSSIAGVENNPNFGVRILAAFAPGQNVYTAANPGSTYGGGGSLRYDMVTISGDPAVTVVPEPSSSFLLLGGAALIGLVRLRRK